jgi:hypothetical protein
MHEFFVNDSGTIDEGGEPAPERRADIYHDIDVDAVRTPSDLLDLMHQYPELSASFETEAEDELVRAREDLADEYAEHTRAEWRRLERLQAAAAKSDALTAWITFLDDEGFAGALSRLREWLDEGPGWDSLELWPRNWSGQARAYDYYESLDAEICKALGVFLVDGDGPGSDYIAAELRASVEKANQLAEARDLPFRFRRRAD